MTHDARGSGYVSVEVANGDAGRYAGFEGLGIIAGAKGRAMARAGARTSLIAERLKQVDTF